MKSVAFKVTYNDGGAEGGLVGYRGVCTDPTIVDNVKIRRMTWCSQPNNQCRKYYDRGLTGSRPQVQRPGDGHCYESRLLLRKPLRFGAGYYHSGPKKGQPLGINQVEVGDLAILTTIPPGKSQEERIIFGCYRVGRVYFEEGWGNLVESDGTMDVVVPDDIVRDFFFWNYQKPNADGTRKWGSGLFRYLSEESTRKLIENLLLRLGDAAQRDLIVGALERRFGPKPPREIFEPPVGGWGRSGGESDEHRNLKHLVAASPELLDLPRNAKPTIEHAFLSGDRVDVKFDLPDGSAAVVEIETICPLPGAHQAVKYRALLEVERRDNAATGRVQAILVAHLFDGETRDLAQQYNIKLVQLQA